MGDEFAPEFEALHEDVQVTASTLILPG